jgi:hypothetical protein
MGSGPGCPSPDVIGMSFIPLYFVMGPLMFFLSLLLMVWGVLRATA